MIKEIKVDKLAGIVRKYGDNRHFYNVDSPYAFPEFAEFLLRQKNASYSKWVEVFHPKWSSTKVKESIDRHYDLYISCRVSECRAVQIWGVDKNFNRVPCTKFNFDGYHRLTAYQVLNKTKITCEIGGKGNQDA